MPTFNTTDPKPGYVYDSGDDTWYPLAGIAVQSLDGLTDVVISTAASGQTLVYNGTNWVNTAETGDVSAVSAGTGITVTSGTGPIPSVAIDTTLVATTSNTMTLSNKTLTAPTIQNPSVTSGTFVTPTLQNPSVTSGTFVTPTLQNPSVTSGTFVTPTLQNPSVTSGTFIGGTFTSAPEINRPTITGTTQIAQILESAAVTSFSVTGTVILNVLDQGSVVYYTSSASANYVLNVTGSSTTSLVNLMSTGQSLTVANLVTNGAGAARYLTAMQIDGTAVTSVTKWQGGTAPTAGNTSAVDIYSITAIKVANTSTVASAFTVFAAQTKFA